MSPLLRRIRLNRPIALVGTAVVTALLVSACGAATPARHTTTPTTSHQKVVLQFWNNYNETQPAALSKVIAAFEQKYPYITIQSDVYPYAQLLPKLLASIAAGNPPALFRSDIAWVPQLSQMGALVPLSKSMPGFKSLAAEMLPGPLSTNYWRGIYYGLPLDTNTQVLFWNKTDFKAAGISKPPTTLAQLYADAKALTDPAKGQWGLGVDGTDIWNVAPYIWSSGGNFTNAKFTTASGFVNSKATVATITQLVTLYKAGVIGNDFRGTAGSISGEEGFPKGQYAMYIDGPWAIPTYQSSFPTLPYGTAPFPSGTAGSLSTVGGQDIVIPSAAQHVADAELFVRFVDSAYAQLTMAPTGAMAVNKTVGAQEVAATPYLAPFVKQLATARARPPVPQYSQIDADFGNALDAIFAGAPVQSALNSLASETNALLVQNS